MIFQGIQTSIAKKPNIFVIFQGGGGGGGGGGGSDTLSPPPLDPYMQTVCKGNQQTTNIGPSRERVNVKKKKKNHINIIVSKMDKRFFQAINGW